MRTVHPPCREVSDWNATIGDHFYTVDRNDGGLAYFGYGYEGVVCWVYR